MSDRNEKRTCLSHLQSADSPSPRTRETDTENAWQKEETNITPVPATEPPSAYLLLPALCRRVTWAQEHREPASSCLTAVMQPGSEPRAVSLSVVYFLLSHRAFPQTQLSTRSGTSKPPTQQSHLGELGKQGTEGDRSSSPHCLAVHQGKHTQARVPKFPYRKKWWP